MSLRANDLIFAESRAHVAFVIFNSKRFHTKKNLYSGGKFKIQNVFMIFIRLFWALFLENTMGKQFFDKRDYKFLDVCFAHIRVNIAKKNLGHRIKILILIAAENMKKKVNN